MNPQILRMRVVGQPKGFALVVVLSLMILLTLLAVGLLSLSSVALRSSSQGSAIAIARSNARLAMLIALGELQKAAGPDQRATAPADFAGDTGGNRLAAGKSPVNTKSINNVVNGLTTVQPGTRYWTGVWDTVTAAAPATQIFTKTPGATNVRWLISGNEIGLSSSDAFNPASPIAALSAAGAVADARKAALLVGPNTAGPATPTTIDNFVAAPLVEIQIDQPSGGQTRGRYAWWIGDEGVKASINVPRKLSDGTRYASLAAQRRGWETVTGLESYPTPDSPLHPALAKVVTLPEAELLLPVASGSGGSALQAIFHSATSDSMAVIADPLNGGTRIDLSGILASGLPSSNPVPSIANYPVANSTIVPRTVARTMRAPRWDALKEFYDRSKNLQSGALIVKAATSDDTASIAPLVTEFRILMGVHFVPGRNGYKANPCGKIAIALANPYSKPLKWERDIEFEVMNMTPPGNAPSRIWSLGGNSVFIPRDSGEGAVFNNVVFRLRAGTLPAGEARAYTNGGLLRALNTGAQRATVDLTPFGGGGSDFKNSVELDTAGSWASFGGLDVRESWQTTLVKLEMRMSGSSGSSQPLRRIERFELDNGYFSQNTLRPDATYLREKTGPVPLMCYSFQISQPGVNYLDLMPKPGYEMGQRGSTLRTFMDFNLQATRISKPIASYNPPPYFMQSNNGFGDIDPGPAGGNTGSAFSKNLLASPLPWGRAPNGPTTTVLFSVPSQITSLAQFQHADLTGDDAFASIGHQPGNAFANSYATPFVKRTLITEKRTDLELIGSPNHSGAKPIDSPTQPRAYYDISHLLNTSIWDTYFLSTIGYDSQSGQPEHPAFIPYGKVANPAALGNPLEAASGLMIEGSFNVNSTDKNAWKAFLASTKHFKHQADVEPNSNAAFPRSLEQLSPAINPPTGTAEDSFSGFRRLTDVELDNLATEIVKQVRLRGPFVSLSHFVNRALGDITRQGMLTRSGALQTAIDEAGININFAGNKKGFKNLLAATERLNLSEKEGAPRADLDGGDRANHPQDIDPRNPDWAVTSTDNNFGSVASIISDRVMIKTLKNEQGYRSTGIPGWLTQADVLQVIGPVLTTRSDTFRIRAYGEALSPDGKTVLAKAWCEAIVQRVPEYLDLTNAVSDRVTALTPLNRTYGRRFHIVSFHWLSQDEI